MQNAKRKTVRALKAGDRVPVCLLSFAFCLLTLSSAHRAGAAIVNRIVATIDGEPLTLYEFTQFADRASRGRPGVDEKTLLDAMITDKLLQKEINEKGIIVRDEDVDQYIASIKERNKLTDEQLQQALTQQGLTLDAYRKQVREEIQKAQLINREIRGKVNVPPEEVERYYQAHLSEYETAERMHLSHIVIRLPAGADGAEVAAAQARADDLYQQLKKGADFAEVAKQHSEDPAAKDGGDLGWLQRGEMLEPIEKGAGELKPGQFSKPVRSDIGIHILKLEAREGASHKSLEELGPGIKEQLYNAALEARYEKWLSEELRKRHAVEINE